MFYRKIELCMGDDMHATCTHEQEMVDHVIPELQDKVAACYNESTKVHNAQRVHKVVTESDVANVEIISWNCIIILHVNL